jgi:hypothetical protein
MRIPACCHSLPAHPPDPSPSLNGFFSLDRLSANSGCSTGEGPELPLYIGPFFPGPAFAGEKSDRYRDQDKTADEEREREEERGIEQVPGILMGKTHDNTIVAIFLTE